MVEGREQQLSIEEAIQRIKQIGIIAIVRGNFPLDEIIEIGDALLAAPVQVMEITMNSTNALSAISDLRKRYGENMLIGAGTVRTAAQLDEAVEAGAQFTVAPTLIERLSSVLRRLAYCICQASSHQQKRKTPMKQGVVC